MALTAPITKINRTDAKNVYPFPVPYNANNMSAATGANSAAQVSVSVDSAKARDGTAVQRPLIISELWWSYSGTPTAGRLTVIDSGGTYVDVDITAGGKDSLVLTPPLLCGSTSALTVTLAGAGAVTGKVGVVCWRQE